MLDQFPDLGGQRHGKVLGRLMFLPMPVLNEFAVPVIELFE